MTIERAIKLLMEMYQKAQQSNYVQKPVSWALYQTWEFCDKKEKPRLKKGRAYIDIVTGA